METTQKNHLTVTLSLILIALLSALIALLYINHETLAKSLNQIGTTVEITKDSTPNPVPPASMLKK